MKQLVKWFMMLFMVIPMLCACGDDNDDDDIIDNEETVGTWKCTESTDIYAGETYDGLFVRSTITIKSDGTYTSSSYDFGIRGTYVKKGNKVTVKSIEGDTYVIDVSINGNKMTWSGTSSYGAKFYYKFKRV